MSASVPQLGKGTPTGSRSPASILIQSSGTKGSDKRLRRRRSLSPSSSRSSSSRSNTSGSSSCSDEGASTNPRRRRHRRRGSAARLRRRSDNFTSISTSGIASVVWNRTAVLVSLLLLQSLSQLILESYEGLISSHVIIPLFLTMLVGAGGNAGNQSTVRSITGLVTGEFSPRDFWKVLRKEVIVGLLNATILATIGFARVYYFYGHRNLYYSTIAITASLFCIVSISVVLGTILPFALGYVGLNREHAAPVIQVMMDIVGVLVTCSLCYHIIPDSEHTSHDHDTTPKAT